MRIATAATLIIICSSIAFGQGESPEQNVTSSFRLGFGGIVSSYQDTKLSDVRYGGPGAKLSIGYEKRLKNLWGIDLNILYSKEKAKTHTIGQANVFNPKLSMKYLWQYRASDLYKLRFGATWDVVDLSLRVDNALIDNSIMYVSNSGVKFSSLLTRKISKSLIIDLGLDVQLFGFVKEISSFGVIGPQTMFEQGDYSYYDTKPMFPYSLRYYGFEPFWDYINLGTSITVMYSKRWDIAYKWNLQRSHRIPDYALTRGYNSIAAIWKFAIK